MYSLSILSVLCLGSVVSAYDLPVNLKAFYNTHKLKSGTCSKPLSGTFPAGTQYCGDVPGAIFLKDTSGNYDNMDIDCDGANNHAGACANDPTGQGVTAFRDTVAGYGIPDLDANLHPYVVFGNDGDSPSFDPQTYGMKPLSVMAIICDGKLHYGIWGDVNGGTSTGEASISLANLCFPNEGLNGNVGHDEKDVLYIGFTGEEAVPGKNASWAANSEAEFSLGIKALGDRLVSKL
ncbi:chitosanase [Fusarium langsethiae]|uniref:Endo-chitosanase n=1 Tax=Fusarium langsethiae TaxID=179993 RepID=A0A0N0DAU4_FUSLA|nr:chitosanase [Fusarium langsethiae]